MGWTIDTVFQFIQFLIRKNQSAGITVSQFQLAWNSEQLAYMSDLLGRFQARSNGKQGLNIGLIQDETIMTKLTPFINPYALNISYGVANKPGNLLYTLAARIGTAKIMPIRHDQIFSVQQDIIDPPSITDASYYYTEYLQYFAILPNTFSAVGSLDYVATPTDVVWNYSVNVYGRKVYNPIGSVSPMWDSMSVIEISKRTLRVLGISFKDSDFEKFGESTIVTGN